jgi:hypothetical protein
LTLTRRACAGSEVVESDTEVRSVALRHGGVTLVDAADYDRVAHMWWRVTARGYASTRTVEAGGTRPTIYMHRLILDAPRGVRVDHINGVKLDNRRANLRLCTQSQNMANIPSHRGSSSPFKGVHWSRASNRWVARIGVRGKKIYLGIFVDPVDAAIAYDKAALDAFGEFARLNFPVTNGARSAILTA